MKKYYLSKIFRDDGAYAPGIPNAWMHRLQTYPGVEYLGGEIAVNPVTGLPTQKALLCLVGGINHAKFAGDKDILPLPAVSHDMKVSAIHTATKLKAKADIKALGFGDTETETVWGNADGMRDVLNHYGRLNNPAFNVDDFDLDES